MKKVYDERLKVQYLKNFKAAFLIENMFMIVILCYELFKNPDTALSVRNPLWIAIMIGVNALVILAQNVTAVVQDKPRITTQRFILYFLIELLLVSLIFILIMPDKIIIDLLCGLAVALVTTGIMLYNNRFRY
ncbi:hypothetical protein [Periweissella beninensis]|uniref:hypothetical protein n=1 Tax=Periweissella beninensis TaxID=504936 RepID=UPI0021A7B956|nr:hypothetical protein [Periweissella beninensis]MCT4397009.1 hypothetical protein [Periweissella beninensis]